MEICAAHAYGFTSFSTHYVIAYFKQGLVLMFKLIIHILIFLTDCGACQNKIVLYVIVL